MKKIKIEKWLIKRSSFNGKGDYVVIECSDITKAVDDMKNAIKKLDEYEVVIKNNEIKD